VGTGEFGILRFRGITCLGFVEESSICIYARQGSLARQRELALLGRVGGGSILCRALIDAGTGAELCGSTSKRMWWAKQMQG